MKELHRKRKILWNSPFITYSLIRHMQADWLMWLEYLESPEAMSSCDSLKADFQLLSVPSSRAIGLCKCNKGYLAAGL